MEVRAVCASVCGRAASGGIFGDLAVMIEMVRDSKRQIKQMKVLVEHLNDKAFTHTVLYHQKHGQLARMAVLLLVSSLCCPLHAQYLNPADYITSQTNVTNANTKVLISAPFSIFSTSLYVFTTGIPIQPVYIQGPSGLVVWMTLQCRGGAARVTLPDYVANYSYVQTDPTGQWIQSEIPENTTQDVTGLGIKFMQNISICNDALSTLLYGKGADNDIVGRATMTITLLWTYSDTKTNATIISSESKCIYIWAPTALTNLSTYQLTVAAVCLMGVIGICCLGCANSHGIKYLRNYNVIVARDARDEQECDQNRVFNPMWMPCAPSHPGYYHIESTPNPLMLAQRHLEIKCRILRIPATFSLMDRLWKVRRLKNINYGWSGIQMPCTAPPPPPLRDSSSDDEMPAGVRRKRREKMQPSEPLCCSTVAAPPCPRVRPGQFQDAVAPLRRQPRATGRSTLLPPRSSLQQTTPPYPLADNSEQAQAQAQAAILNPQNPGMYPRGTYNGPQRMSAMRMNPDNRAPAMGMYHGNIRPSAMGINPGKIRPPAMGMDSGNRPQEMMYPGPNQYARSADPGDEGNSGPLNYETITVGFAFAHHRFAHNVHPTDRPQLRGSGPTVASIENYRAGNYITRGTQEGHVTAVPEHLKGKKSLRVESLLAPFKPGSLDEVQHITQPKKSQSSVSNLGSRHYCEAEEGVVNESLEISRDSVALGGRVSAFPSEKPSFSFLSRDLGVFEERGSEDSDRTSEPYGSPLSEIYEDVLESCSPSDSIPRRSDQTFGAESPFFILLQQTP